MPDDLRTWDAGGEKITIRKDLRIPMRDGVELAADAYHAPDDVPRPALIAMSAYGVVVAVRAIPNREHATMAFWAEAVDRRLQRGGTYRPAGQSELRTERGQNGKSLRYTTGDPQNGGTYWVTVFVTNDWVYLLEAGGATTSFARAQPEVDEMLDQIRRDLDGLTRCQA